MGDVLAGGHIQPRDYETLADKLYFDREPGGDAYVRFWALLVLSVVIATGSVATDSTAGVIGAMIVAPLMTPIMASALAVVTGDLGHLRRSLALVLAGAAAAVALAFLIGTVGGTLVTEEGNSQVAARTAPRTMDLVVALASGAAGAFAVSRAKVIDALPGVAIAISLVPPLCVVGLMLANDDPEAAAGALLLFITNFLAIVAAGGITLAILGYGRAGLSGIAPSQRRATALVIGTATVLIVVPLALTSARVAQQSLVEYEIQTAAAERLPAGAALLRLTVTTDEVDILVDTAGRVELADLEAAAAELHELHPGLTIRLRVQENTLIEIPAD
jgi:uncharacterized hydrophobic protein (TIGR00271 family)